MIREVYLFAGISDPDDMAVVYAIESTSGIQGTFIDAFGGYADPAKTAVLCAAEPARWASRELVGFIMSSCGGRREPVR